MKFIIFYELKSIKSLLEQEQYTTVQSFSYDKSDEIVRKILKTCQTRYPEFETLPAFKILQFHLNEIVNNALDSIAEKRLSHVHYDKAVIKVVVVETETSFRIKIKDNGIGLGKKYTSQVTYDEFEATKSVQHFQKKEKPYCIGGHGIGLFHLSARLAQQEAILYLKSRREEGVTVEIVMKKAPPPASDSVSTKCSLTELSY